MKLRSGICTSQARLEGKTVLITGANTGIGKVTAEDLYRRGARVVMACKSIEKAEEAVMEIRSKCLGVAGLGDIVIPPAVLDLSSFKCVRSYAQCILQTEKRLDVLVNNAGVMCTPQGKTEDGFETQFGINHLGPFMLTMLLMPRLIATGNARIVNVTSATHSWSSKLNFADLNCEKRKYLASDAYNCSKLCNVLFTRETARRLEAAGLGARVKVYAVHPGVSRTELGRYLDQAYFRGMYMFWRALHLLFKTAQLGAQTTIYCAVDERCASETGMYYTDCEVAQPSADAANADDALKLWTASVQMCALGGYEPFVKPLVVETLQEQEEAQSVNGGGVAPEPVVQDAQIVIIPEVESAAQVKQVPSVPVHCETV